MKKSKNYDLFALSSWNTFPFDFWAVSLNVSRYLVIHDGIFKFLMKIQYIIWGYGKQVLQGLFMICRYLPTKLE